MEIWLTNAEKENAALRERLKPLYGRYAALGYLVTVFQSGEQELSGLTGDLLCYNRRRSAEQEVQMEKSEQQIMSM